MSERGRAERPLFFSTNKNKSAGRTLESIGITQTSHIKNYHVVTYCLLCRWANYILQPLYSESCHQETIAIT